MSSRNVVSFPRLDALRAICFLLVFGAHVFYTTDEGVAGTFVWQLFAKHLFGPGAYGVNMFFALSGFLITYLLITEERVNGHIDVPRFWMRRILRIWPIYYAVVAVGFLLVPFIKRSLGVPEDSPSDPWPFLLFFSNFAKATGMESDSVVLDVLWSIAVEEQFYLVWPLLLRAIPSRQLALPCILLIGASFLFRLTHEQISMRQWHTFSCMGDLATGALGAILFTSQRGKQAIEGWSSMVRITWPLALAALYFTPVDQIRSAWSQALLPTAFAIAATGVILVQVSSAPSPLALPTKGPLSWLGRISYGLYCLHMIGILITLVVMERMGLGHSTWHVVVLCPLVALGTSIALAFISNRWFERPFLQLKDRFAYIHRS